LPRNRDSLTLRHHLERLPIHTVIDVGANDGTTSQQQWLATLPTAKLHLIAALERYREQLVQTATASCGRMTVWPLAVTDSEGEGTFYEHVDHPVHRCC
jgi:hypothetical protein